MNPPLASSIGSFADAAGHFFSSLASVGWGSLGIGLVCFGIYLSLRSRAFFNVLRAAYPAERFRWRRIWGAYIAAYGFNNIIPARGGDLAKLFLVRTSIPNSTYSTVASAMFVELVFDAVMGTFILIFAFSQGVFPKPPDFAKLNAFDLSWFAGHPRVLLFCLTLLAILALAGFALLSARVKAFWARVRQGIVILFDRRRYVREVFLVQLAGWGFRFTAFWFLLDAFHVGGSLRHVLLVLGVYAVSAVVPFTPGGAGVQQALLVKVFGTSAGVAAYSVGQQVAIGAFCLGLGFAALVTIFRVRSFKDLVARGRAARAAERDGGSAPSTAGPAGPRARA